MSSNEANSLVTDRSREPLGVSNAIMESNTNKEIYVHSEKDSHSPKLRQDDTSHFGSNCEFVTDCASAVNNGNEFSSKRNKNRSKISRWGGNVEIGQQHPRISLRVHEQREQQRSWNGNTEKGYEVIPFAFDSGFISTQNIKHMPVHLSTSWQSRNTSPITQCNDKGAQNKTPPPIPRTLIVNSCNSVDSPKADKVREIMIDGVLKEIRFYDNVAIVFMDWDQPREITFKFGQRSIRIDNSEAIVLQFNDDYKPIVIDGQTHHVRFGLPSRELYIDEHWYEIFFGGPCLSIPIQNKLHVIKAEGPPPQINVGPLRFDLVVGKLNMYVDSLTIPLFIDAKPQKFKLNGTEHIVQFADNLLTVLTDGVPNDAEYGGMPKRLIFSDKGYYVRFGILPNGIVPGKLFIKDMVHVRTNTQSVPICMVQELVTQHGPNFTSPALPTPCSVSPTISTLPSTIDINELFKKLVSSGIITSDRNANVSPTSDVITNDNLLVKASVCEVPTITEVKEITKNTVTVNLTVPKTLKVRQAAVVERLYSGTQCSSCGVRFLPEQTMNYSQHLDWHFRQKRKERDTTRTTNSRKWYYKIAEWMQFEEVEDTHEGEQTKNYVCTPNETSTQQSSDLLVPTCTAGPVEVNQICGICEEKFEEFYNEELDEWQFRLAIRVGAKIYHQICYEDYKVSLNYEFKKIFLTSYTTL